MSTDAPTWQRIRYDEPVERVARITLARPEMANAQDFLMLSELNQAFDFVHPYEAGARLAKDMLFTGRSISAAEALQHGMVNRVVARDHLESETLRLAAHIARRPMFGLTLAKQSVNNSQDAMGMYTALQSAFGLHHVGHNHNLRLYDMLVDPAGAQITRDEA